MKKPIFISILLTIIALTSITLVKSTKKSSHSMLVAANIEALTQKEDPDQGEEGTTSNNDDYWVTTKTTEEFFNDSNCCYRHIVTTEADCLPDGQQDCTPKTYVEVFTGHRYHHV